MAVLFLDSSALVKRYVAEAGSSHVAGLLDPAVGNVVHIAAVTGAEVIAALVRRQREGSLSANDTARAIAEFREDWTNGYEVITVDRALVDRAMQAAERHGLRGYDAIQLASAMEIHTAGLQFQLGLTFVSTDEELNAAAMAEGLQVENPNLHL
ncbi:MAG: type II toxin-antitoxin system VapC family toxin [Tepidisphaeraceae bacterium]|jgi:hypothetical protein